MSFLEKVLGPKSKYCEDLPYTYEARIPSFEDGEEHKSYFSDTICGLIEYLHRKNIAPGEVEIFEIFPQRETPIDHRLLATADQQWLFKPDICRAFGTHYPGHIANESCSFKDRGRHVIGP